jgi:hypothetical protein
MDDKELNEALAALVKVLQKSHKKATLALRSVEAAFGVEWVQQATAHTEPAASAEPV